MSESTSQTDKAIHVIPFSGKTEDYGVWVHKFKAVAMFRGYDDILDLKTDPVDVHVKEEGQTDEEKKKIEDLKAKNKKAYVDLILSSLEKSAFQIVKMSRTSNFPEGDAREVWFRLKKQYEPDTNIVKIELQRRFFYSRMTDWTANLETYICELMDIKARLIDTGIAISDEQMMIRILDGLPDKYQITVEIMEQKLGHMTLNELRGELQTRYQRMASKWKWTKKENKETSKRDGEDTALVANFKGRCNKCGNFGHKAADCKNNDRDKDSDKFTGKCQYCEKTGHHKSECRKYKTDKKKQEKANVAAEPEDYAFIALDEPVSHECVNASSTYGADEDDIIDCQPYCIEDDILDFVTVNKQTWNKTCRNDMACVAVAEKEIKDMCCEPLRNNLYKLLCPQDDEDEDDSAYVPELSFHDSMQDFTLATVDIRSGYLYSDSTPEAPVNQDTGEEDHGVLSKLDNEELDDDDWDEEDDEDHLGRDNISGDGSTVDFNRPTEEIEMEEDDSTVATVTMEEVEAYEDVEIGDSIGKTYLETIYREEDLTYLGWRGRRSDTLHYRRAAAGMGLHTKGECREADSHAENTERTDQRDAHEVQQARTRKKKRTPRER